MQLRFNILKMSDFKKNLMLTIFIFAGLALLTPFKTTEQGIVTVHAEVELEVIPNVQKVTLGYKSAEYTDQKKAFKDASKVNKDILNYLESIGLVSSEYETGQLNLNESFSYYDKNGSERKYEAYVDTIVTIGPATKSTDSIDLIIANAVEYGATNISQVEFKFDKPEVYHEQMRSKLIDKLTQKADSIADLHGQKLGKLMRYTENSPSSTHYLRSNQMMEMATSDSIEPIETAAGTQVIKLKANAEYAVK